MKKRWARLWRAQVLLGIVAFAVHAQSVTDINNDGLPDQWQSQYFGSGFATSAQAGPNANPAGDGTSNLLKYAFAMDPTVASTAGLPVTAIQNISGTKYLTITFHRRLSGTAPLAYSVQTSADLVNWSSNAVQVGSATPDANGLTETATYRDSVTVTGNAHRFMRVLITATPIISSPTTATATTGSSFSYTITGTQSPTSFSATGLPPGLSLNSSIGVISGTPTTTGTFTINLTATDSAGTGTTTTLALTVSAPVTVQSVQLPLEVMGANNTTAPVSFTIPAGSNLTGTQQLWLQIHNLKYQTQASVQVNGGAWIPINDTTVTLLGHGADYGGIGGGFATLKMTLNLPAGAIHTGQNTATFRFNATNGVTSGFRVLNFNVLAADSTQLLPQSSFTWDDPVTWQPPLNNAADIAAGKDLWHNAALTVPNTATGGTTPILAHCADCHAQDGRDLKYFNYSNNSIVVRSQFHNLTQQQGQQIASYIRSLNAPAPAQARPWNPPYQPGPGLDSKPVAEWSAGAGLDAVLNSDQDVMNTLFPGGVVPPGFFSQNGVLNIHEIPIAIQLPDWNRWLPTIHPMDAWSDFLSSTYYTQYSSVLRTLLLPGDPTNYYNRRFDFQGWGTAQYFFTASKTVVPAGTWTPAYVNQVYSTVQWGMVKSWELNQEFQLEGMARTVFKNPKADSRAWYSRGMPFFTSPNMQHIPPGAAGLDNGSVATWTYLASIWYHVQLILDNSEYEQSGNGPIDWAYVYGLLKNLSLYDNPSQGAMLTIWLTKALQISSVGIPPDSVGGPGFNWKIPDVSRLVASQSEDPVWTGYPNAPNTIRGAIATGMVQSWLADVQQFTPQQYYAVGIDPNAIPAATNPDSEAWQDRIWYMIPPLRYYGVPQPLIDQMIAWAQTMWPKGNWSALATTTCWVAPPDHPNSVNCQYP